MKQNKTKKIRPTLICYMMNGNEVICDKYVEGGTHWTLLTVRC